MKAQRQADIVIEKSPAPRPLEPDVTITIPLSAVIALGWILGETTGVGLGSLYRDFLAAGERALLNIETGTLYKHESHGLSDKEFVPSVGIADVAAAEKAAQKLVENAGYTPVELV